MMDMVSEILTEEEKDEDEDTEEESEEESEEEEKEKLDEELTVDTGEEKHGWITTDVGTREYDQELRLAKEECDMYKEKYEALEESLRQSNQDTEKLLGVVEQLKSKLDEALVSNARLVYSNKTLSDASLNERQKSKIVEAIAKATSAEEVVHNH
jgi:hypothetical protein